MSAVSKWTISSVREALVSRQVSARELTKDFFERIDRENPKLNAYLALSPERAYSQADRVDAAIAQGDLLPPLAGVPVAIKDVLSTTGIPTTCGSKILQNYTPPYDATAVARLETAGAVILGKTNCDEFAMGSSNENSAYGPVRNPVALDRVPGGSSGGSAAAVAANLAVAALGTDTPARCLLRYSCPDAHIRPRIEIRFDRICVIPRSHRSICNQRKRCRTDAFHHRRP